VLLNDARIAACARDGRGIGSQRDERCRSPDASSTPTRRSSSGTVMESAGSPLAYSEVMAAWSGRPSCQLPSMCRRKGPW
jgi:hypothetical protein